MCLMCTMKVICLKLVGRLGSHLMSTTTATSSFFLILFLTIILMVLRINRTYSLRLIRLLRMLMARTHVEGIRNWK